MSEEKYSDPVELRKMTMKLAQAGFGIHPERHFLYMNIGEKSQVPYADFLEEIAIIHYEADIVIASTSGEIEECIELREDNIYFVPSTSDELDEFLQHKAQAILTEEVIAESDREELKNEIIETMKREGFARNEDTKVFIYKIATNPKGLPDDGK